MCSTGRPMATNLSGGWDHKFWVLCERICFLSTSVWSQVDFLIFFTTGSLAEVHFAKQKRQKHANSDLLMIFGSDIITEKQSWDNFLDSWHTWWVGGGRNLTFMSIGAKLLDLQVLVSWFAFDPQKFVRFQHSGARKNQKSRLCCTKCKNTIL